MSASNLPANDLRRVALCWDANDGAVSAWPYNKPPPSSTDTNPVGGDSSDPSDRFSGLAPTRQKQAGYRGIRGTSVTSVTECFPPLNALAQPDLEGTSNVQSL